MTQPLAIVLYERLLPGSQLINRLQDLHYRVHALSDPCLLASTCQELTPLIVIADLDCGSSGTLSAIAELRANPATQHLPVIGFCAETSPMSARASEAGTLTAFTTDTAVVNHLKQILDQALRLD